MADLSVNICGVELKNPVITASGCFGFGREYSSFYDLSRLGGIAVKGLTLEKRGGNPPPRIAEYRCGMLNSVGLQNPGVDEFIDKELPWLLEQGTVIIANIAGNTIEDYSAMAERLSETDLDFIELNISCPNVKEGGIAFGTSCSSASEITAAVKKYSKKPLIVKLSPNVTDITEIARAVEYSGADAVSLINTLLGMRIDIDTKRPVLHNNVGGISGSGLFPLAVRMVWQVAGSVKIPVIGIGGITTPDEAVEMMMAGACAVQVGTAIFTDPMAPVKIIEGIEEYMNKNNIKSTKEITGSVRPW